MSKIRPDRWGNNPAQVTSFIEIPTSTLTSGQGFTHSSPTCGLGWKFDFSRNHPIHSSAFSAYASGSGRPRITVTFRSNLSRGTQFRNLRIVVNVEFKGHKAEETTSFRQEHYHSNISTDIQIGTYEEPTHHRGRTIFEITVIFDHNDQLSFPTTLSPGLSQYLAGSLDGQQFIDTKFYLFSSKVKDKPAHPRAVFGNAGFLKATSAYFQDLLSDTGFQGGVQCDLHEDVPGVLEGLKPEAYDYDSDSDLDSVLDEEENKGPWIPEVENKGLFDDEDEEVNIEWSQPVATGQAESPRLVMSSDRPTANTQDVQVGSSGQPGHLGHCLVHAYTINGLAYRTWKAFIFYVYTDEISFRRLKSHRLSGQVKEGGLTCSPKSMYCLADYIDLPALKNLAKEGIKNSLSEENVVEELFSRFTSKYDEIIEIEADFLVQHFTAGVSARFDDTLELIVSGLKPYCFRALAFTIKRLHNESAVSAWNSLRRAPKIAKRWLRPRVPEPGETAREESVDIAAESMPEPVFFASAQRRR